MPALDLEMINRLGHDLHPTSTGLMAEEEVCPWTLFLTMALTLLKGVLPHVPKMLPVLVQDEELRERAIETFTSDEFKNNIEEYFVENIKNDIQAPLNRQIIKSSETVMYGVDIMNNLINTFIGGNANNDLGKTDNMPRGIMGNGNLGKIMQFAKTLYQLV